mgnify:FL=1|jgi:hypothetical protein
MTKNLIAIPIGLSPIMLLVFLEETSANEAYPPEADSLGAPLFSYLLFLFPLTLYLLSKVQSGPLQKPKHLFWNSRRHAFSAASLILSIFPLGLFWVGLLLVGISSKSYATAIGSSLILVSILLVRTFAIQPEKSAESGRNGD